MVNTRVLTFKTAMSILLIVVFCNKAKAQANNSFLKDYYRFGIFGQYTVEKAGVVYKEDPNVNFDLKKYVVQQTGIIFNAYQHKNWLLKTGIILKHKMTHEKYIFTRAQIDRAYPVVRGFTFDVGARMYAIPIIAEYIVPITKRIKWEIAPSFSLAYFTGQEGSTLFSFNIDRPNPPTMEVLFDGYYKNPLFSSAEISTGFYVLFKYFMLQPEFRYSKSFRDVLTGYYTVKDFKTEPHNSKGTFKQSGDYWGFSLSIYVKKINFRKKKKAKALF